MLVKIPSLGECNITSPLQKFHSEQDRGNLLFTDDNTFISHSIEINKQGEYLETDMKYFEKAGPRKKIFFQPERTIAGIVTCGGICPGLNNVIRSLVVELWFHYGIRKIWGFRYGYEGLNPEKNLPPLQLDPEIVDEIHDEGGTILGTSRGPQDPEKMVSCLRSLGVNLLFCVGGDGTHRGAYQLFCVLEKKSYPISIIGIPKTIDNDILYTSRTFGFNTAIEEARKVLICAHTEAKSVRYGIGLVKLMGRDSGFVTAYSALASQLVNYAIIPEVPVSLYGENGFLPWLEERILTREHALIAVAEGAGAEWMKEGKEQRDASGNVIHPDPGKFLRDTIINYFGKKQVPIQMKYFDPSYLIRSVPANAEDSAFCDALARNAVHAGMTGRTGLTIGYIHNQFVHIPIEMVISGRKKIDPNGSLWQTVLASTGQPIPE
ncbi:MAG: ATP-dependent 6-phosphofructokinase [Candidatus Hydrogenedens sp.]